jgi:Leucine-rich repeat (LRR) protein
MKTFKTIPALLLACLFVCSLLAGCSGAAQPQTQPSASVSAATSTPQTGGETPAAAPTIDPNAPIAFADPVFEKLLKTELGKDEILPSDLAGYKGIQIAADEFIFLEGNGKEYKSLILFTDEAFEYDGQRYTGDGTMESLADLMYFPDLKYLRVTLQPQIDYTTIPESVLAQLTLLNITQSKLTGIAFIGGAGQLVYTDLYANQIADISGIEQCTKLKRVNFDYNQISDISPLAGLGELTAISCYGNKITDISALAELKKLEELGFYDNQVSDISVLSGLPNLKSVEFINNQIEDVSPLAGFDAFERLALKGNPIKNIGQLSHIKNLEF